MFQSLDRLLNSLTMYRVVLYGLLALAASAIVLSAVGILQHGVISLLLSLGIISVTCWTVNVLCSFLWRVPANAESWLITALILFFLFSPVREAGDALMLALGGVIAMASKYLLAIRGKHMFNPAAFAAAAFGLAGSGNVVWWVGTPSLLLPTVIIGLLIVRKTRRFPLFTATVLSGLVIGTLLGLRSGFPLAQSALQHIVSWPLVFFASVMVTEPLTLPPRRNQQVAYGAGIGALSSWPVHYGFVYFTPELVLLIGNLLSYAVSLRRRLILPLIEKRLIARDTYEYVFGLRGRFSFLPGQYLEWMLPHAAADTRGNRRYFTIASSPAEGDVRLGVKIGNNVSSFKKALSSMQPGENIYAGQLGGDFVLPRDKQRKLAFIAGGIGITPFRSMIRHLMDRGERRDIVLLSANRAEEDVAYRPLLDEAEKAIGLKTAYVFTLLEESIIRHRVPDFQDRIFYLSGPTAMVDAYKALLKGMGVPYRHIITDYFPGFA